MVKITERGRQNREKNKERRKQKEESEKLLREETPLVKAANEFPNPLDQLVNMFKTYDRNGLNLVIECKRAKHCSKEIRDWAFQITKQNMESLYGEEWNDRDKKAELTEDNSLYLLALSDGKPVGFSHFRYDIDYDRAVLYCYELQVEESVQRKGLGKFLMQILELLAAKSKMAKVVLTVFLANASAMEFYAKMRYAEDVTSPKQLEVDWDVNYMILSKVTRRIPVSPNQ